MYKGRQKGAETSKPYRQTASTLSRGAVAPRTIPDNARMDMPANGPSMKPVGDRLSDATQPKPSTGTPSALPSKAAEVAKERAFGKQGEAMRKKKEQLKERKSEREQPESKETATQSVKRAARAKYQPMETMNAAGNSKTKRSMPTKAYAASGKVVQGSARAGKRRRD